MIDDLSPQAREYILAFADDEHLIGQQHTEWIGIAPFLEEDLAFASIGQDELGHAALLYGALVGETDQAIDGLAFFRDAPDWRSCKFVESAFGDWEDALIRHWLYDEAEVLRWQLVAGSSIDELASISVRALSEETFHIRHARAILDRLLVSDDARTHLDGSLRRLLPLALGLFEGTGSEAAAISQGVAAAPFADQRPSWQAVVDARFDVDWTTVHPATSTQRTERHPDFAPLLSRIREVFDFDRSATW